MQKNNGGNKVILGGGIAGLLQAYFNPDAVIITDQIGGQFSAKFQLGPKYLHVDDSTKRFFEEIDIKPDIKKIKIGFFYDGHIHSENTEENRKRYFEKTRGSSTEPYKSVMSANKTEFDSFDIGVDDLIKIIKTKIDNKVILEKIEGIDLKNKEILTKSGNLKYEQLISTIPMNTFLFLCDKSNIAKSFQSYPTTFIFSETLEHCPFNDFENYDYIYVSEPQFDFHRITKVPGGVVFEYKGNNIKSLECEKDRVEMKVGQLVQNDINIDFKYVKFFGRYANWRHNVLVNDLLKQLYEINRNI